MFFIVSKYKEAPMAVNFANCLALGVAESSVIIEKANGKRYDLAEYESPERAGEVVAEILEKAGQFYGEGLDEGGQHEVYPWTITPPKVYYMPEE